MDSLKPIKDFSWIGNVEYEDELKIQHTSLDPQNQMRSILSLESSGMVSALHHDVDISQHALANVLGADKAHCDSAQPPHLDDVLDRDSAGAVSALHRDVGISQHALNSLLSADK